MPVSTAIHIEPQSASVTPASQEAPFVLASRVNLAVKAVNISVSSTAIELTTSLARRRKVYIKNLDGNEDIYVGGSGVTTANGYPLKAKEELWIDLTPNAKIYAIKSGNAEDIRVLEAGV